jgi:pimeloyl-ACP methyl ester carboxylesterase
MTTLFVHGVPETAALWDRVRGLIGRDSSALRLPGFGVPRPDDHDGTMDAYVDWLLEEIRVADGPVDIVGHDWGGILVARVATYAPAGLRSWVSDAPGAIDPAFEWHDFAKIWQTPGEGEAFFAGLLASPPDAAAAMTATGVPEADAPALVAEVDDVMVDSILRLYRSATEVGTVWAADGPSPVPGMVLVAEGDLFGNVETSRRIAADLGATFEVIPGGSHFWPLSAPEAGAAALERFWASLD